MNKVYIFGAGGHAVVVADALQSKPGSRVRFISEDPDNTHHSIEDCCLPGDIPEDARSNDSFVIGIGSNSARKRIAGEFGAVRWIDVVHASSVVSGSVRIGEGSVVLHNSVVQAYSEIGRHCIVNTNASVDHDCLVGDFVHIAPNSTLCGAVNVGESTFVGAGATILPGIRIGSRCVIGAGAVITKNVPDDSVITGVPGRCRDDRG